MTRTWGFWTRSKLDILRAYLPAFTRASSKKASGVTVYLDLFAGLPEGTERITEQPMSSSVMRALDTAPRFTRYYFFELPAVADDLAQDLAQRYPGRGDYRVVAGDSNDTIDGVLTELRRSGLDWAPTFAFLDPRNLAIKWATIEKLADFKRHRPNKVELWVLCFSSAIPRVLGGEGDTSVGAEQVTAFYGTDLWQAIRTARNSDQLSAADARDEYVNLYRWRLEKTLGYRITHSFVVKNTNGSPLYHLILATDNKSGSTIMRDVYAKAAGEHEGMRREAAERRKVTRAEEHGRPLLYAPQELAAGSPGRRPRYEHEPPWTPFGSEPST